MQRGLFRHKAAIKAAGQTKKDYVAACRAGTASTPAAAPAAAAPAAAPAAPAATTAAAGGKTAKECNAEYSANKAAIKAGGQTKKDFVASCRAGNEPSRRRPQPPRPLGRSRSRACARADGFRRSPRPPRRRLPRRWAPPAGGFATDAQAKAKCPSDTVVWSKRKSGVYHFAGTHDYGNTKQGAYMCEADAKDAGDRPPRTRSIRKARPSSRKDPSAWAEAEPLYFGAHGADGGGRTRTALRPKDFKSFASTGFATSARAACFTICARN